MRKRVKGCGGLRKVRLGDVRRSKGKRGGTRVIYLHVPAADCILLLDIYGKDEKADLGVAERKLLKRLADDFKNEIGKSSGKSTARESHG